MTSMWKTDESVAAPETCDTTAPYPAASHPRMTWRIATPCRWQGETLGTLAETERHLSVQTPRGWGAYDGEACAAGRMRCRVFLPIITSKTAPVNFQNRKKTIGKQAAGGRWFGQKKLILAAEHWLYPPNSITLADNPHDLGAQKHADTALNAMLLPIKKVAMQGTNHARPA